MVQEKYTTKREKGKHLTSIERGKIEAFFREGYSKSEIARLISVSRRTIQREIQRGWVKGSNENNNKLIRRHIPKGRDISKISEEKIKEIEEWINTYPRKLFNGKSAMEIYSEEYLKYFS